MTAKIGVGIVGLGRIGKLHAEHIQRHNSFELIGFSDVFLNDSLKEWGKDLAIVSNDYMDLIKDERVQAIFICSPTNTHIEIIKQAASHKKHIFCEKPVSFHYEDTKEILELVDKSGVIFQVGFNRRFDHNFSKVKEHIVNGEIGQTQVVKITSRDPAPPPASYIEASGGMFMDMSIHDFDMARFLSGSEVETVYAEGAVLVDPQIGQLGDIDTAIITLKFTNGVLGVIDNCRKAVYGYDQRVEVLGDLGCVSAENDVPTTVKISTKEKISTDHPKYFFLDRYIDSYISEINDFANSIKNGVKPSVSLYDGLQAERIAFAAKKSLLERRVVHMNEVE